MGFSDGCGLAGHTLICLEEGEMTMIIFIYYLLVRVTGSRKDTEGRSEDARYRSQGICPKSTVKNGN